MKGEDSDQGGHHREARPGQGLLTEPGDTVFLESLLWSQQWQQPEEHTRCHEGINGWKQLGQMHILYKTAKVQLGPEALIQMSYVKLATSVKLWQNPSLGYR